MELDWHVQRSDLAGIGQLALDASRVDVDENALALSRLQRVRTQMQRFELEALLLNDPVNIRYACGARNMQVFAARNGMARYLLVTHDRTILFEMGGAEHLARGLPTLDQVCSSANTGYVATADGLVKAERQWTLEMGAWLRELAGRGARIGTERLPPGIVSGLLAQGFELTDAQGAVERARAIKTQEELQCIRASLACTEVGVAALHEALQPGMTENELWSVLHQAVIAGGGEYFETRLLNSGQRSNPWFQETGAKRIARNELVALDTDVVGCFGYYADFSRTFHAGPEAPTSRQRDLYKTALEQVSHNLSILRPGMSFRDYAREAWPIPERFFANRYYVSAHGVGMTGEYPYLYHHADFEQAGYDGEILPGMTLCVESFIGAEGGEEGVKLEQQVLITGSGTEILSNFPFEETLR
ncbi:M24 family metallopeptidase [Halomonas organivorans]|uniref:Xaa-Pro aminopeptidase n=1 Tax=Halomonas organivorans TaxID=257772 RepID=A0A7W5G4T2_9GAMM|nr:Xaa-Pro peptidase family protein [Halomonas organivorans]MBB3139701.1 Xaa-Pro aminopeptidase [Halomonas organivorans]